MKLILEIIYKRLKFFKNFLNKDFKFLLYDKKIV